MKKLRMDNAVALKPPRKRGSKGLKAPKVKKVY